jgi:glycogen debranching enzyme
VLDTPPHGEPDGAIRPNQIFALSLPFPLFSASHPTAQAILRTVQSQLLTPFGLRTLAPDDPHYAPRYEGDVWHRDTAYHQGTAWPWLLGAFAEAVWKVTGSREEARRALLPLSTQMEVYGVGSLPEIYDGSEPQRPNGCIAQAWSVAEVLRVLRELRSEGEKERS